MREHHSHCRETAVWARLGLLDVPSFYSFLNADLHFTRPCYSSPPPGERTQHKKKGMIYFMFPARVLARHFPEACASGTGQFWGVSLLRQLKYIVPQKKAFSPWEKQGYSVRFVYSVACAEGESCRGSDLFSPEGNLSSWGTWRFSKTPKSSTARRCLQWRRFAISGLAWWFQQRVRRQVP